MKKMFRLPSRQVHLDFHTGPAISDVGVKFDSEAFAETMRRAHVNSVTVFAKCHHGHLYYETNRPERHPGLRPGAALLEQQVEALHRRNIRAPIYLSVQCDEYAANTHPDWVARKADSAQVKWDGPVFNPGWQILDMSSPYQDFLADQLAEVLARFHPVDGIFFDMCWDQPSTTKWAIAGMRAAKLNPESEADRATYANRVTLAYMQRFYQMVKFSAPDATVFFNCRSHFEMRAEAAWQTQGEIESLPTGGWGYLYFPANVRSVRTLGKPYLGMTARFHKGWADFGGLKPYAALEYETSQMIAHGAQCSIGDQLHPRGETDAAAYNLIGRAYRRVADREPWLEDAKPAVEIGLFHRAIKDAHGNLQHKTDTDAGATRMLQQLQYQFDLLDEQADLSLYKLLILPDGLTLAPALRRRIAAFVKKGGRLLVTGGTGLSANGKRLDVPGFPAWRADGFSPFSATYMRFSKRLASDEPATDHVMYEPGVRIRAPKNAQVVAQIVEPYFERAWDHFCSHNQTPGNKLSPYVAAFIKSRVAYISHPIFEMFARHGNQPCRTLTAKCLEALLPRPLIHAENAPIHTEFTVMDQPAQHRRIVHMLFYPPVRTTSKLDLIEDILPVRNIRLMVRTPTRPRRVYLAPSRKALAFAFKAGVTTVTVPELRGHAMVVFEAR